MYTYMPDKVLATTWHCKISQRKNVIHNLIIKCVLHVISLYLNARKCKVGLKNSQQVKAKLGTSKLWFECISFAEVISSGLKQSQANSMRDKGDLQKEEWKETDEMKKEKKRWRKEIKERNLKKKDSQTDRNNTKHKKDFSLLIYRVVHY